MPRRDQLVLDARVLRDLETRLGKDRLMLLVEMFQNEIRKITESIGEASDPSCVGRHAHALISLAGNLGCAELMAVSRELNLAIRRQRPDTGALIAEMTEAADRALDAIALRYPARDRVSG
jgi:HPt (histidine-containing phosphotransfer) domain-containing protein